jgi:hypothetical protein
MTDAEAIVLLSRDNPSLDSDDAARQGSHALGNQSIGAQLREQIKK